MNRISIGLLFSFFTAIAQAQLLNSPQFAKNHLKLLSTIDVYSTKENFDNSRGNKVALPTGNKYDNIVGSLVANYGLNEDWELFGGFNYSYAKSLTGNEERKGGAFTDISLGANYRWFDGKFSLYPGLSLSLPVTTIASDTDDVLINDGASILAFPFYLDYKWSFLALYSGFTPAVLGDQRGWRIFYSLGVKKRMGPVILNLEFNGMDNLKKDELTTSPNLRTDVVNRVNAGSLRYYSINPGFYRLALQARFRISQMFIGGLGYSQEINGSRYSSGKSIIGYLEMRFPEFESTRTADIASERRRAKLRQNKYADEDADEIVEETVIIYEDNLNFSEEFEEDTVDEDLEYFEKEDLSKPPTIKRRVIRKKGEGSNGNGEE